MQKIYFHADDYGRSHAVSKNIMKCLVHGSLNSVSIMINHEEKCHKKLKKLKNVNKRLHLNLTEIPKTQKNNNKYLQNLSFFKLFFINGSKKKEIFKEINNQIKKFKKIYKPRELKIDGHEHVHMIPWILEYLLKQKKHHKIKELRNSNERLMYPRLKDFFNPKYVRNFLACVFIKILYNLKRKPKMNAPQFAGLLYTGMQNTETVKKTLTFFKRNKYKNCEILIHPGYTNRRERSKFKKNYFNFYNSQNRKTEFNLCFSKEIKNQINKFYNI